MEDTHPTASIVAQKINYEVSSKMSFQSYTVTGQCYGSYCLPLILHVQHGANTDLSYRVVVTITEKMYMKHDGCHSNLNLALLRIPI